jgi:dsRNA-specific ribonuclease
MKRLQLLRWSGSVLSPRIRPTGFTPQLCSSTRRLQSSASAAIHDAEEFQIDEQEQTSSTQSSRLRYASPPVSAARESAKLAALHARLYLPDRLPVETLARTLVDPSADPHPSFNNEKLATLGNDLLTFYTSEHIMCTYPRLPMTVIFAAMYAFVGPKTLAAIVRGWGVEFAAAAGGEVDPGLLQFKRVTPGVDTKELDPEDGFKKPRGMTSRIFYDNEFGEAVGKSFDLKKLSRVEIPDPESVKGATAEEASAMFVRAVMGAIYLHAGRPAAKRFFREHFLSRHLDISKMFNFTNATRDLSKLCRREAFEAPVAKVISETGRLSRHPVFVVGIFSGKDKLGEGSGGSLSEARTRAAVAALKGWYLYSPLDVRVPSSMEEEDSKPWQPAFVDLGEVIV